MKNSILAGMAAISAACALSAPALAQQTVETRIAAVQYTDLDLTSAEGHRILQRRIEAAAREVCGVNVRASGSLMPHPSSHQCYARAIQNIDREVAARTGHTPQRG